MSPTEIGDIVIALVMFAVAMLSARLAARSWRDRIYDGITPGQLPLPGGSAPSSAVTGKSREYEGEAAVQFTPPAGVRPGLAGTIIDGQAEMRDVTAMIIDLAVRGYVHIEVTGGPGQVDRRGKPKSESVLRQVVPIPAGPLEPIEAHLLSSLFATGPEHHLGKPSPGFVAVMHQIRDDLAVETVRRGWYVSDPRISGKGPWSTLVTWIGVLGGGFVALQGTPVAIASGLAILASMLWARGRVAKRVPRTADGTAARIQTLGFKKYLETAEADQIKFEEAADIFSRYLPYAIAFGVAQRWAKVFGGVAARAQAEGYLGSGFEFTWLDAWYLGNVLDTGTDGLFLADAFGGGDFSFVDGISDLAGGLGELSGGFADGIGDAVSGIADSVSDFDFDF